MPWTKRTTLPLPRTELPFGVLPEEFSNLFNRFFFPVLEETAEWPYRWGLTLEEKEKEVLVRMELPGFTPEEIKLELLPERLTVEAEHKEPAVKEGAKGPGAYTHVKRTIALPPEVAPEKAEAIYRNGVLEIHFPRKPEVVARRIEVKT
jgi:HSP20 family protein